VAAIIARYYRRSVPQVLRRIGRISKTEFDAVMADAQDRLTTTALKEMRAELEPLIETMPNPKLQPYKRPVEAEREPVRRVPRVKAKKRLKV
jgi:hypothetical protein